MAASKTETESDHPKPLTTSTTQKLWDDKDALGKSLDVVQRSKVCTPSADEVCTPSADTLEQYEVRPAKPTFHGVQSTEFQS